MEMKDLELKAGNQHIQSFFKMAQFKLGNVIVEYRHVLQVIPGPEEEGVWVAFLMRTIKAKGENYIGEVIGSWVGRGASRTDPELTDLINKDREMLLKQILQEDNEE
jgi:hypothetical protein|nr:MAG TPA: hypothetical protein [Crassvirales sp.]